MPILRRHEDPRDDYCGGKKDEGGRRYLLRKLKEAPLTQLKRKDPKIHEIVHNNELILLTGR